MVLAFIIVQIISANLYLRVYKQGPLEWLWRTLYNKSIEKKLEAKLDGQVLK
ncbi:DUF418 domain-containing protein [uncultured Paraglaciecola sp.]|uniref:DUF418 domain-containing protein n=1 Tax=uncultured Paraglaciecola sp. TaxID=1765024 RepID=UPI00344B5EA8